MSSGAKARLVRESVASSARVKRAEGGVRLRADGSKKGIGRRPTGRKVSWRGEDSRQEEMGSGIITGAEGRAGAGRQERKKQDEGKAIHQRAQRQRCLEKQIQRKRGAFLEIGISAIRTDTIDDVGIHNPRIGERSRTKVGICIHNFGQSRVDG
jgi:hypothetical protein